uniref:C3H1-type domain-containing protein n=1 Tax=Alexandrium monilatum TaxID=311494 RepID=A0A7S4S5J0_9DINO
MAQAAGSLGRSSRLPRWASAAMGRAWHAGALAAEECADEDIAQLLMTLRGAGVDCREEEEEDEDDLPYGKGAFEKFAGWPEIASDGESETTHAASENHLADISSGSDDELRGPAALRIMRPASASALGFCGFGSVQEESGVGLVDLHPAEGRRRGDELLSLLLVRPTLPDVQKAAPPPPPKQPPPPPHAPPPPPPRPAGTGPSGVATPAGPPLLAAWASEREALRRSSADLRLALCSAAPSVVPEVSTATAGSQHAAAVSEAASRAFGADLAEVVRGPSGYALLLRGREGAALRRGGREQLDTLGCALWPLLVPDVVGMQSEMEAEAGQVSSGSRLTVWCLAAGEGNTRSLCWDFARCGACPRGGRCRWLHAEHPTYNFTIELVALA